MVGVKGNNDDESSVVVNPVGEDEDLHSVPVQYLDSTYCSNPLHMHTHTEDHVCKLKIPYFTTAHDLCGSITNCIFMYPACISPESRVWLPNNFGAPGSGLKRSPRNTVVSGGKIPVAV